MSTMMTIDTAPRDEAALTAEGVFIHRRIAEALTEAGYKLWTTEKEKATFITAPPADRARAILHHLRSYDVSKGGAPAPVAPAGREPAAAATETAAPVKRQPRTPAAAPTQAQPAAQAATNGGSGVEALLMAVKTINDGMQVIHARVEEIAAKQEALSKSLNIVISATNDMKVWQTTEAQVSQLQVGMLALFGQQVLGGVSIQEIVPTAIQDANTVLDILEATGKD